MAKARTTETVEPKFEAAAPFAAIKDAIENVQSKIEIPAAARDFVKRSAETVQERTADVHAGALNITKSAEKVAVNLVGGYALFTRGLIDASFANVQHALSTVEKVAAAKSVNEALQIQAEFVRESAKANYDRVVSAGESVKAVVNDGVEVVKAEWTKIMPAAKAA
ncbi:MAG: phasin family protein [Hyphomonas sp.]|jgi:hypothetical protein|nr:phasin family protein [Hyphomonas sp.]